MASHLRRLFAVPAAIALAFTIGSCGGDGGIGATLADFSITLEEDSAAPGDVTFDVTNESEQTHEFVVLKTDIAEGELPTDDAGDVDEAGDPGIELVDEIEDIAAGDSPSLTVNLDAGSYVLICNLPGHYGQGMHTSFTVS